jgi:hypothetical protein
MRGLSKDRATPRACTRNMNGEPEPLSFTIEELLSLTPLRSHSTRESYSVYGFDLAHSQRWLAAPHHDVGLVWGCECRAAVRASRRDALGRVQHPARLAPHAQCFNTTRGAVFCLAPAGGGRGRRIFTASSPPPKRSEGAPRPSALRPQAWAMFGWSVGPRGSANGKIISRGCLPTRGFASRRTSRIRLCL